MPQVASDAKIHAPNPHMPRVARPAPSDRAPSPFESLIDDTSQPVEAAPPPKDSKVAKNDDKQAPAKSKDCKTAEPNDDTKPANTDEVTPADEVSLTETLQKLTGRKSQSPTPPATSATAFSRSPIMSRLPDRRQTMRTRRRRRTGS